MNHERLKGMLLGVTASALVTGFTVTAFAANRNITVSDGIRVVLNGQAFQPKDGNGAPVELFSYNGTIYAPMRAICEAAGMNVSYDNASKTATITTGGAQTAAPTQPTAPAQTPQQATSGTLIGEERAKQIALDHAKISAANATFVTVKLDQEMFSSHYDVEFYSGNTEYDYEIDAVTGAVIEYDHDYEANVPIPQTQTQTQTQTNGTITADRAKEIALGRAPGATVVKCKLDYDDGRQVYEIELRSGRTEYECDIDAATGTILKWETDYD